MSGSLLDEYVKKLSQLEEGPFQRAIVQRLLVAVNGFQTIPASPQGDGGLDGFSHKGVHGYCCYGLKFDSAKTPKQRSKQLATKFTDDLARLYELVPCPGGFKHKPNEALMRVFGALPPPECRLQNITLLANWFESHEALGAIRQAAIRFAAVSQARWLVPDVVIVLMGPKEFADRFGVDESTMLWLNHQELWTEVEAEALTTDLGDGPTFDSKMRTAEALAPGHSAAIRTIADILRADWQRSVAFDRYLSERLPHLHGALERGRRRLLVNVLTQDPGHPWAAIRSSQSLAEAAFSDDFLPLYGASRVRELASGETARLVGACPVNWMERKAQDDE